jgi:regulatory protein
MPFAKPKKPRAPLDYLGLLDYAVKSLGAKMKSERDLRRRLNDRVTPDDEGRELADRVIAKLKDLGYLSDERFAADYTRLRQQNEKLGKRRVQQGLMQKGIAQPLANATLATQYDEIDEVELARAYIARKRMKQPEGADREALQKATAKTMRRLVSAGFSTRAIWKVLRDWNPELSEDDISSSDDDS